MAGFGGDDRLPSISLYREAVLEDDGDLTNRILERFVDASGAYKRTYSNRFQDFDTEIVRIIEAHFGGSTRLRVHDAAVSDARTSCDFFDRLSSKFSALSYRATDFSNAIRIVRLGGVALTFSADGELLEAMVPPFVHGIKRPESFRKFPLNRLHQLLTVPIYCKAAGLRHRNVEAVQLWCRRALKIAQSDPRFSLGTHDLLQPFAADERHDVIRAMNILQPGYFSPAQIRRIAENIIDGLRAGGLFVLGRNEDANTPVLGAVYVLDGDRFREIYRSGKAAPECAETILATRKEPKLAYDDSVPGRT
ncbi:MAG TPA: hypothetical protein VII56_12000 [Rhizomicrobium sp.]